MSRIDRVGIAAQADIDTQASAPSYGIPVEVESVGLNRETIDIDETLGSFGPTTSEYGTRFAEGSMNGAVRPVSFPLLLAGFMGKPTTTGTGPYIHTFDPLVKGTTGYPEPLSIWGVNYDRLKNDAGTVLDPIVSEFIGAVGNELTLSAEVNNYVRFDGSFASKGAQVSTDATPVSITSDTSRKWVFNQVKVEMDVAPIATYVETYCQSFSFTYSNNLITDLARLGSNELYDLPLGNEITSTLTVGALANIPEHYIRSWEDSPTQVAMKITATGALISGSDYFTLTLEFPYLETTAAPIERSGTDTLRSVDVVFNVVTDPTTGKLVTPVIKNSTTGTLYHG